MGKKGKKVAVKKGQRSHRKRTADSGYETVLATMMFDPACVGLIEACFRDEAKDKLVTAEDVVTYITKMQSEMSGVTWFGKDTKHSSLPEASTKRKSTSVPRLAERILLLVLRTKEERANIPGDLEEEYRDIAAKHGVRYAKVWYYKQVASSAWPAILKIFRWGLLISAWAWIRRLI